MKISSTDILKKGREKLYNDLITKIKKFYINFSCL